MELQTSALWLFGWIFGLTSWETLGFPLDPQKVRNVLHRNQHQPSHVFASFACTVHRQRQGQRCVASTLGRSHAGEFQTSSTGFETPKGGFVEFSCKLTRSAINKAHTQGFCAQRQRLLADMPFAGGQDHKVLADMGCRNTVFNAKAQSAASRPSNDFAVAGGGLGADLAAGAHWSQVSARSVKDRLGLPASRAATMTKEGSCYQQSYCKRASSMKRGRNECRIECVTYGAQHRLALRFAFSSSPVTAL